MLKDLTIWILTYVLKRMAPQEVRAPGLLELNSALAAKVVDLQQQIDELSEDYGTLKDKSLMLAQRIKDESLYLEQTEGSLCLKLYKILQANEQLPLTREDVQQAVSIDIPEAGIMAATGSANLDKKEKIKSIDFLYVIKAAHRNRYKIGHSLDPAERVRTFQTGSPEHLTVVGKWPGGRTLEALLHSRLGVYCWQLEWFDLPDKILHGLVSALNTNATESMPFFTEVPIIETGLVVSTANGNGVVAVGEERLAA